MREGLLLRRRAQLGTPLPVLLVHLPCHRRRGPAGTHPPTARHAASDTQPRVAHDTQRIAYGTQHATRSASHTKFQQAACRARRSGYSTQNATRHVQHAHSQRKPSSQARAVAINSPRRCHLCWRGARGRRRSPRLDRPSTRSRSCRRGRKGRPTRAPAHTCGSPAGVSGPQLARRHICDYSWDPPDSVPDRPASARPGPTRNPPTHATLAAMHGWLGAHVLLLDRPKEAAGFVEIRVIVPRSFRVKALPSATTSTAAIR
jgi:hypothetical protein